MHEAPRPTKNDLVRSPHNGTGYEQGFEDAVLLECEGKESPQQSRNSIGFYWVISADRINDFLTIGGRDGA